MIRPKNARELVELIRGLRAKVNLIALNPGPGIDFQTPAQERVLAVSEDSDRRGRAGIRTTSSGRDIYAACGQLKRTVELARP